MDSWGIWGLESELCIHNGVSPVQKLELVGQLVSYTGAMLIIPRFAPISQVPRDTVFLSRVRGRVWTACHLLILQSLSRPPPCNGPASLQGGTEARESRPRTMSSQGERAWQEGFPPSVTSFLYALRISIIWIRSTHGDVMRHHFFQGYDQVPRAAGETVPLR